MKCLVTGATGFLGSKLTLRLLNDGAQVKVLVRKKSALNDLISKSAEVIEGDLRNIPDIEASAQDVDFVFHTAAVFRDGGLTDQVYWDVHVDGTKNLLEIAHKRGIKKFIHTSTMGVHGHVEQGPANENYRFNPGDIYQKTKLEGELAALKFAKDTGLPLTVIRPCAIYGPGDLRLLKLFKLVFAKPTIIIGNGKARYHLAYIDDLVQGFLNAAESKNSHGESFLIGGEEAPALNELVSVIADLFGRSDKKIHLPVKPFQRLGDLCEKICIPLGIDPPIYRRRVDFFTKNRHFTISKAKEKLKYSPKFDLRTGLKLTGEWYLANGYLK